MAMNESTPTTEPHKQTKKTLVASGVTQYTTISPKGAFLGGVLFATVIAVIVSFSLFKSYEREVELKDLAAQGKMRQLKISIADENFKAALYKNDAQASCVALQSLIQTIDIDPRKQVGASNKAKRTNDSNLNSILQEREDRATAMRALVEALAAHPDAQCAADVTKGDGPILWQRGYAEFRATGWQFAPSAVTLPTNPTSAQAPAQAPAPTLIPPASPGLPSAEPNVEPKK
jgi:hypothetical protein